MVRGPFSFFSAGKDDSQSGEIGKGWPKTSATTGTCGQMRGGGSMQAGRRLRMQNPPVSPVNWHTEISYGPSWLVGIFRLAAFHTQGPILMRV